MPVALEPTEPFQARVVAGRRLAEGGDLAAAEVWFRGLLDEARGSHLGNHVRALSSLVTLYGRAGRYLESHALARQVVTLASAAGLAGDATVAFALAKVCGALSHLHLVEPLGDALDALRAELDRLTPAPASLELEHRSAAGTYATWVGDVTGARRHVEVYRAILAGSPALDPVYRWALAMADGRVSLLEGRAEHARRLLDRLGVDLPSLPYARVHEVVLAVEVHVALGDGARARAEARRALDLLARVEQAAFQAADLVHQGTRLTRALEALGAVAEAQEAYDLLAAAVLVNLAEVERCRRTLPELGLDDPTGRALLADVQREFRREQHEMLERVARLLAPGRGDPVRRLLAHDDADGLIAMCAWCRRVRSTAGAWLPVGHFFAHPGVLHVTHGICPPCAASLLPA